jgi:hypothetical protein
MHTAVEGRRVGRRVARTRCLMHLTMSTFSLLVGAPTDVEDTACADVDIPIARHATTSHLAVNTTSTLAQNILLFQLSTDTR